MIRKKCVKKDNLVVILNKKVYFNFFIKEIFQAGLILKGPEVKSIRLGLVNISTAYISIYEGEAFLHGANFEKLVVNNKNINQKNHSRPCKLLLNKHEINFLENKVSIKGCSILPLSIFLLGAWFKIKIGVAIGKKNQDKRLSEKKRNWMKKKSILIKKTIKKNTIK